MEQRASIERQQELQLLSAVLDGDHRASRSFFDRYNCTIEMCVRKVLRSRNRLASEDEVRDLVGEIWLSLLEDDKRPLRRFNPEREVRVSTWIGLLARNKAIDRLRLRQERTVSLDQSEGDEPSADAPLPSDQLEQREEQAIAARALDDLSAHDRAFLEAWYLSEREPEAMAGDFGISLGTVYSRRFKIQAKLTRSIRKLCRPGRRPAPRRKAPPRTIH
jgi:RNA polymerase sigma-70 factor, ECF subfamily